MIKVGDGFTHYIGGDAYPYTVVEVLSSNKVVVLMDSVEIIEDEDGNKIKKFIPRKIIPDGFGGFENGVKLIKRRGYDDIWNKVGTKYMYVHGEREHFLSKEF